MARWGTVLSREIASRASPPGPTRSGTAAAACWRPGPPAPPGPPRPSVPFPTYAVGENLSGTQGPDYPSTLPNPWVVSDGTIITPAGTQVYLGTTTRAKAVALNPNTSTHTAAVLQMGAPQAVTIFNTQTGAVVQNFNTSPRKRAAPPASPIRRMA